MFFRNFYYSYLRKVPAQDLFEEEICTLGEPYRVQHPFSLGKTSCIADFYLPRRRLIIEIDGKSHQDLAQIKKDHEHTLALEERGYAVVRVTNEEVFAAAGKGGALKLALSRVTGRPSRQEVQGALDQVLSLLGPPTRRGKHPIKLRAKKGRVYTGRANKTGPKNGQTSL